MRARLFSGLFALALLGGAPAVAAGTGETWGAAAKSYSPASLKGEWVWAFEGRLVRYQYAQLGLASFDGKGECVLTLAENSGANGGYDHASSACTYEVDETGLGRIDFALDGEVGAAMIAVGPKDVRLASPDPGNTGDGVMKRADVAPEALSGRWTFSMDGTIFGEKLGGAGVMAFDGEGSCSQAMAYNYGTGVQEVTTDSCTYEVLETGIGLATITYSNGTGGNAYFLTANGSKDLFLLTTAEGEVLYANGVRS